MSHSRTWFQLGTSWLTILTPSRDEPSGEYIERLPGRAGVGTVQRLDDQARLVGAVIVDGVDLILEPRLFVPQFRVLVSKGLLVEFSREATVQKFVTNAAHPGKA